MRLLSPALLIFTTAHHAIAAPTSAQPQPDRYLEERGFLAALSGAAGGGNITSTAEAIGNDVASIITDVTSLVQDFIAVVAEIKNASTQNDLVNMLGLGASAATTTASATAAAGTSTLTGTTSATASVATTATTADTAQSQGLGTAASAAAAAAAVVVDAEDGSSTSTTGTASTTAAVAAAAATTTCPGMAVLFARGTDEPGNVGLFAGPSFFTALRNYVNGTTSLAIQGVPYTASVSNFLEGGSAAGSTLMASFITKTATACPDTKLVVSGYSQGAQVVHNAMTMLSAANSNNSANAHIMSVVLFGDPLNGTAVAGVTSDRVLSLCNTDDDICAKHGDKITLDHLTYSQNAPQAAMFVMQKSALGLASADATNQGMGNVPTVKTPTGTNGAMQVSGSLSSMISGLGS
ncbi:cutinase-domain-containing protein [Coniella lustricola]|uniref:Cutinase n=1 Tax=Coniella lustricola TaxID=2025994 RepID=A0A2T3ALZ6_9PEZI|nr:cutinase-domain-containing protein [Coniella lustricola]